MGSRLIGFVTAAERPDIAPNDRLAAAALEARGARVIPVVWSRSPLPPVDLLVIRSTWDYHLRRAEFESWLSVLEASGMPVHNSVPVLRWNLDKRYLRSLAETGLPVTPTAWLEPDAPPLARVLEACGWDDVVVKPVVSASGWRTFRTSRSRAGEDEAAFRLALEGGAAMVQPFVPAIEREGEWSLIYIGGCYTHAALKRPPGGGFLVQTEHGGAAEAAIPTSLMLQDAERVLAAAPGPTLYARVDGYRQGGRFVLMELELLEPDLFFGFRPEAAAEFADAILR